MAVTKFQGAKIMERGVTFAIVVVEPDVVNSDDKAEAKRTISIFQRRVFPGMPVILMANNVGVARYYGREDIVKFLSAIPVANIPWQEFTFTEQ
jgi:signal recognition particle receptor subunit beta